MTINNDELHGVYLEAMDGQFGDEVKKIADACDEATSDMLGSLKYSGVKFPNDDRCMNVELAIFEMALTYAGFDYRALEEAS